MLARLPAGQFPLTVDAAAEMGDYGSGDHYDFILEHLVRGLRSAGE